MKQRILALALTVAMLLSLFPGQVFAAETPVVHTEHSFSEVQTQTSVPEASQVETEDTVPPPTESTEPSKDKGALTPQTPTPAPLAPADPLHMGLNSMAVCPHETKMSSYGSGVQIMNSGNYYLTANIDISGYVRVEEGANVRICLNGKTIHFKGSTLFQGSFQVAPDATLTICDCQSSGLMNSVSTSGTMNPMGILHQTDGTSCFENLTFKQSGSNGNSVGLRIPAEGTGLQVVTVNNCSVEGLIAGILNQDGTVTVNGGSVKSTQASSSAYAQKISCGVINGDSASSAPVVIDLNGVTVSGYTHGIQNRYSGVCNVNDGVISGPKYGVEHTGATFSLSGNVEITGGTADIFLGSGKTVTIAGKLTGSDKYTVCTGTAPTETTPVQITTGWEDSGNTKIPFEYYQPGFMVREMEASTGKTELFIVMIVPHIHCEYGHNCPMGENCNHEKINFDKSLGEKEFKELYVFDGQRRIDSGKYILTENFTADMPVYIENHSVVYLCLNGHELKGNKTWHINNSTLYICDCDGSGSLHVDNFAPYISDIHLCGGTVYTNYAAGSSIQYTNFYIEGGNLVSEKTESGTAVLYTMRTNSGGRHIVLNSGKIENHGSGWGVAHLGLGKITLNGTIEMEEGEQGIADFYLWKYAGNERPELYIEEGFEPKGETYTIDLGEPMTDGKYRFTVGWGELENKPDYLPFRSVNGYVVLELYSEETQQLELYLVIPQVLTDTDGNGTLTMTDPTAANVRVGSTVTLTATPNEGCFFKELTVTYQDGEGNVVSVPVIRKRNETFTFVMPDVGVVHCYASFAVPHEHYMAVDTEKGLIEDGVQKANWCDFSILLSSYADLVALDKDHNESNGIQLASGSYVLTDSFTCDNRIEIVGKANLCLNGKTLTMNNLIFVASYTDSLAQHGEYELHICDCSAKPESEGNQGEGSIIGGEGLTTNTQLQGLIAIRGNSLYIYGGTFEAHKKPVVYIEKGGSAYGWPSYFNFYGGQIRGNETNAVYNGSNGAVWIEIRGGLITTNQGSALHLAYGLGGGVIMSGGKVEATGTSSGDHGMHVRHCSVEMTGGEVTAQGGDGINYNAEGGMLDIRGGSISAEKGNGIYISNYGGTSRIYGGSVSSQSAYGIYNDEFSTLEIYGGTVSSYAEDPDNGGGILNQVDASTTVYGGQITATAGPGIYNWHYTYIEGGEVRSHTGEGIYNYYYLEMQNGVVNSAESNGIYNDGDAYVSGGTIVGKRHGVYHQSYYFGLEGAPIISGEDGDIYLARDCYITVEGKLTGEGIYTVLTEEIPVVGDPVLITDRWDTVYPEPAEYPFADARKVNPLNINNFPFEDERELYPIRQLTGEDAESGGDGELYLTLFRVYVVAEDHGTVVFDSGAVREFATEDFVRFEVTPDFGYIAEVTATYWDENSDRQPYDLTVSEENPEVYSFTMPKSDVIIWVIYKRPHIHTMSVACNVSEREEENLTFDRELWTVEDLYAYLDENHVLQPGNYVLMDSFTYDSAQRIYITGEVNLCVKGDTLTVHNTADAAQEPFFLVKEGGILNICDCDTTTAGLITGTAADGVIKVSQGATLNLYGGTFASSTGTAIHNRGTVNTDGLITQDSNGNTSDSTTRITGPKDVIVNEFRAELNVTNASVYTDKHTTLIMNKAGTVTVRAAYMETPLAGKSYTCAIYNAAWESEGILYGGSATVEEGTMVTTPASSSGTRGGCYGIYNEAGSVVVNGGWLEVYDRGIVNCDQTYTPLAGGAAKKNNVTVNGGMIRATVHGIHNIGAEVWITGGTIYTDGSEAYWQQGTAESQEDWTEIITSVYNINGGTVDISGGDTLIRSQNGMHALCNCGGVVTINDGTFSGLGNRGVIYNGPLYALGVVPQPEKDIPCEVYMNGGLVTHSDTQDWRYDDAPTKGICNNVIVDGEVVKGAVAKVVLTGGTIDMTYHAMEGSFGVYNSTGSTMIMYGGPEIETKTGDIFLGIGVTIDVAEGDKLLTKNEEGYYTVWTEEIPTRQKHYVQITTEWPENYEQERVYLFRDAREIYQVFQLEEPDPFELYLVLHRHYMAVDWEKGHPDPETPDVPGNHADGSPVGDRIVFDSILEQDDVPTNGSPLRIGDLDNTSTGFTYAYVLKSNLVLKAGQVLQINGNVDICLAGNRIELNGGSIQIMTYDSVPDSVRICDCRLFDVKDNTTGNSGIYGTNISSSLIGTVAPSPNCNTALYGITAEAVGSGYNLYAVYTLGGRAVEEYCTIRSKLTGSGTAYGLFGNGAGLEAYDGTITVESGGATYGIQGVSGSTPGSVVVDGTGITSTAGTGYAYGIFHGGGGAGTIKNSTITATSDGNYAYGMMIMPGNGVSPTTVTDCTVTATSAAEQKGISCYGISITGGSPVDVIGGTVSATSNLETYGIYAVGGANFTAENVEIKAVSHEDVANGIYTGGATVTAKNSVKIEAVANTGNAYGINAGGATVTAENGVNIHALAENSDAYGIYVGGSNVTVGNTEINAVSNSNDIAYGVYQEGTFLLLDGVTITGATADFYLPSTRTVSLSATDALTVPTGETYSVKTEIPPTVEEPVQITTTWNSKNAEVTAYPFTSTDYLIMKLDGSRANELYLVIPVLTLYLWKDHKAMVSMGTLYNGIMEPDKKSATYKVLDVDFSNAVNANSLGLTVGSAESKTGYDFGASQLGVFGGTIRASFEHQLGKVITNTAVELRIQVYGVQDSYFVLDYGHKANLANEAKIYVTDCLPGTVEGGATAENVNTTLTREALSTVAPEYIVDEKTFSQYMSLVESDGKGAWGDLSFADGNILYAPNSTEAVTDAFYMTIRAGKQGTESDEWITDPDTGKVALRIDPTKEARMVKTIKVIPANVVYYDDTSVALDWYESDQMITVTTVGSSTVGMQDGSNPGNYGNDKDYAYAPDTYTGSGGTYKDIVIKGDGTVLSFTFTGTGFDLLGTTDAKSGMLEYIIHTLDEQGDETELYRGVLDTEYLAGEIHEAPLLHKELPYGRYRVEINGWVEYDWDATEGWVYNEELGWALPPVIPAYLRLDGVRIYNALSYEDADREHYAEGEKEASFRQLRDMLLNGEAAAASFDNEGRFQLGSGLISYVETGREGMSYKGNAVSSMDAYLLAGPNNEVYFNSDTQSIVFYVKETEAEAHRLQIGIRNLNPKAFGSDGAPTAPGVVVLGVDEKGEPQVITLVDGEGRAIGYTEQYYTVDYTKCVKETIGTEEYYRVVISSNKNAPFCISNVKYAGLAFAEIPQKEQELSYDTQGLPVGESKDMPNLHGLVWQLRRAYGMLPEDELEEPVDESLTMMAISLSLQSSIGMNIYVNDAVIGDYDEVYVSVEKLYADGVYETAKLDAYTPAQVNGMACRSYCYNDLTAKEMTATVRITLYGVKDGVVTRGEIRDYSVLTYAKNTLAKAVAPGLKTLLVDMLNYGAQAQEYFGFHEEFLANSTLTAQEQALATVAEPDIRSYMVQDDPTIPGSGSYGLSVVGASLSLKDKVELNFYMTPVTDIVEDKTMVIVYTNDKGEEITAEIEARDFVADSSGRYKATFSELTAKDMRTVVTCYMVDGDGVRVSNAMTYSIESYAAAKIGNDTLKPLLMAMMKYGDSAESFFRPRNED